jgi:predicted PurR-regulated permease PerM
LQVVLVLVIFVAANQIDNHLLTPLIMAKSTSLHPVTVILAVMGGFAFGGLVTAVFAVPLVAFAKVLFVERYHASRYYRLG